ncbi:MAG: protein kinase [Myxococcales bacterium]|nr:protein kinase [Myxococcales bacterium]MCB9718459.1 protein kinase [Myxococcales bacterium]
MPSDGTRSPEPPGHSRRYEQVGELARGGMAALYLARVRGPSGFTKYVVLKRILAKWADEEEFVEMFLDEARLAATLDHPNVVHVVDAGRDEEGPFFAMEHIHGEDLRSLLRAQARQGTPLELRHVITIGLGAAAGLHHAHERRDYDGRPLGIIHRDISPSNIIVTFEGGVKIVDFGIAKASTSRHATRPSIRKGKIAYMSPEQCKGAPIDRRSDVFSLGIVLHELCTGRRLFHGDNEFAIMNAIVNHDAIAPSRLRADLPPGLERIIQRALRRSPDERYSDARALQRDLERFAEEQGIAPSATALGERLEELFGSRPYPWETLATARTSVGGTTDPTRAVEADEVETKVAASSSTPAAVVEGSPPRRRPWAWVVAPLGLGAAALAVMAASNRPSSESEGGASPPAAAMGAAGSVAAAPASGSPEGAGADETEASERDGSDSSPFGDTGSMGAPDSAPAPDDGSSSTIPADDEADETSTVPAEEAPTSRRRSRPRRGTKTESRASEPTPSEAGPRAPFDPDGPAPRRREEP